MEKILALVLALVLVLTFVACGGGENIEVNTEFDNDEPTETKVEYYSGTNVISFTSVTGIKLDETAEGEENWVIYDYTGCELSDVQKYIFVLKEDGFTDADLELAENQYCLYKGKSSVVILFLEGRVAVYPTM